MKRIWPLLLDLRALVLLFVLLSGLATVCNSLIVAYRIQRDALVDSTLEANRAYAAKLASSIEAFLHSAQRRMKYSALILADHWDDPAVLSAEANRLRDQDLDLNAVAIVAADGRVLQTAPKVLRSGHDATLDSALMEQTLHARKPMVSSAYTSRSGHLVLFISQPVTRATGEFLGVIGSSVYLRQQSALHTLISSHFHHEGTLVFVVDDNRRVLYHPDQRRIGEIFSASPAVDLALRGEYGAMQVSDRDQAQMLAGYAPVVGTGLAIIAEQPRQRTLAPLSELMGQTLIGMLPASIIGLGLILAGTNLIVRPLRQLSITATQLTAPQAESQLLNVQAWYRDAAAIRRALLSGVRLLQQTLGRLNQEAQSDVLTGLANRRAMSTFLELLTQTEQPYAVLALDIDHFKRVNDVFGHDVGDLVLRHVADILKINSRASDLACRSGGEEFILIMPDTPLAAAETIAQRIRENVATSQTPAVGRLTLSVGVACRDEQAPTAEAVLKLSDERLYKAKQQGRNKVVSG
ncbi:diguanylate cyclase [Pseudomonas plecoglossicida]|uniref:diguanylate cyclase n=1 Tax=Pseudomonas plecoglossicida TaxID=70775 RepID=A0AAD0QTR2_PSEDL|nr:sensor domain-containing diguanylate cyclase [Pseudomonas plecoglossicida]AXM94461.1 GGDEF domain-containing protein [Pseudomonas plecoglossicida]EPB93963.1 diguanylate cyclase [Pseudomonas plecoglossicida NB2011]QLB55194.1 sensor domain-containing diguanylate cyclase [Pseudomonas plecoglossicida]